MGKVRLFWKTLGPRKRVVLLVGLLLLTGATITLVFVPLASKKKTRVIEIPKTKEELVQVLQHDSDNDGLKDWEEKIYGTDLKNPDTDSDETTDGEEIKLSRNPLKRGPDDKLSLLLSLPNDQNRTTALSNTFVNAALTRVIAEGLSGGNITADDEAIPGLEGYIAAFGEERPLNKVIPPSEEEFTIHHDNSPDAVKKYFNAVAQIHISNFSKIDSDIAIISLAVSGNNLKAFRRLDKNIAAFERTIADIKKTPVPTAWVSFAKEDIRYLSKALVAVKILRNSETDPVSSLLILQDRMNIPIDLRSLYLDTAKKLRAEEITFAQEEPAAALFFEPNKKL